MITPGADPGPGVPTTAFRWSSSTASDSVSVFEGHPSHSQRSSGRCCVSLPEQMSIFFPPFLIYFVIWKCCQGNNTVSEIEDVVKYFPQCSQLIISK